MIVNTAYPETESAKEASSLYEKATGHRFQPENAAKVEFDREATAKEMLRQARDLIDKKKPIEATRWLTEILLLYTDTMAAKDAAKTYEELTGEKFDLKKEKP